MLSLTSHHDISSLETDYQSFQLYDELIINNAIRVRSSTMIEICSPLDTDISSSLCHVFQLEIIMMYCLDLVQMRIVTDDTKVK